MILYKLLSKMAPAQLFRAVDRTGTTVNTGAKPRTVRDENFTTTKVDQGEMTAPTLTSSEEEIDDVEMESMTAAAKEMKAEAIASMEPTGGEKIETVCFNVGGQKFEIARSTLNLYPETMLARAASKEWGRNNDFIDRDSVRFRYVLDWMRDREVNLPMTESREAFINEMLYFGFDDIDEGSISLGTIGEAGKVVAAVSGNLHNELEDLSASIARWKKKIEFAQKKQEALKLAHSLFVRSSSGGNNGSRSSVRIKEGDDFNIARTLDIYDDMNHLKECLFDRYGIVLVSSKFDKRYQWESTYCDFVLAHSSNENRTYV